MGELGRVLQELERWMEIKEKGVLTIIGGILTQE